MDTAYKTRAWWMLRALELAMDAVLGWDDGNGFACSEQRALWASEARKAGANAVAPAGSECLTRLHVDRAGNLLAAA